MGPSSKDQGGAGAGPPRSRITVSYGHQGGTRMGLQAGTQPVRSAEWRGQSRSMCPGQKSFCPPHHGELALVHTSVLLLPMSLEGARLLILLPACPVSPWGSSSCSSWPATHGSQLGRDRGRKPGYSLGCKCRDVGGVRRGGGPREAVESRGQQHAWLERGGWGLPWPGQTKSNRGREGP